MSNSQQVSLTNGGYRFDLELFNTNGPVLIYWGPANTIDQKPCRSLPPLPSSADIRIVDELFPLEGQGFFGEPALLAHGETPSPFQLHLKTAESTKSSVTISYLDHHHEVEIKLTYTLDDCGVLLASSKIKNVGTQTLYLHRLNALTLPLPHWVSHLQLSYGHWANEGHKATISLLAGKIERTGRAGRPGFDGGPHLIFSSEQTTEASGHAIGIALANSGNFTVAGERLRDGEAQAVAAEWLHPGEVILSPSSTYETPRAIAAITSNGFCGLSNAFHRFARKISPPGRTHRPVQLNSWEAVYFGVSEDVAMGLADEAAAIGIERFVLDDGWFENRTDDTRALGDWQPDPDKFPNGLTPLSAHVRSLGMEFGIWVEPEMINQNSSLYRRHQNWLLSFDGSPGPTSRNQLVLNLDIKEVRDYLFERIDDLLLSTGATYLKWDCNRDIFPSADKNGPAVRRQIQGLYTLLGRLRKAHPAVSIESCASGGGRIDFGVLKHADRFWTSDSTDPFDRIRIQRSASQFFPLEMLGAHVGASPNHWTGRESTMTFRCLVAFFGHFGVELNPKNLTARDREILKQAIVLYKDFRTILTDGQLYRIDPDDKRIDVQMVLAADQTRALVRTLRVDEPDRPSLAPIRLPDLPKNARWRVLELGFEGPTKNTLGEVSSDAFCTQGFALNCAHGGEGRLFLLERIND